MGTMDLKWCLHSGGTAILCLPMISPKGVGSSTFVVAFRESHHCIIEDHDWRDNSSALSAFSV